MDYKKAYEETLTQLYLAHDKIVGYKRKEERLDMLFKFRDIIDHYGAKLEANKLKTTNQQFIDEAETFYHNLIIIFNHYGSFYISELIARRELYRSQKLLSETQNKLLEANEEIEKLRKSLNFT